MTFLIIIAVALLTVAPLILPRFLRVAKGPSSQAAAVSPGETVIRLTSTLEGPERIELARAGLQQAQDDRDILRDRVIALIKRYPDRGTRVIRTWMAAP